jgi:hypothetical protein
MEGERRVLFFLAAVTAAWACGAAAIGIDSSFLHFAPVFLVVIPLVRGRYIGEEGLHRLRGTRMRAARPADVAEPATVDRSLRVAIVRGGQLLARHIADRPPPPQPAL